MNRKRNRTEKLSINITGYYVSIFCRQHKGTLPLRTVPIHRLVDSYSMGDAPFTCILCLGVAPPIFVLTALCPFIVPWWCSTPLCKVLELGYTSAPLTLCLQPCQHMRLLYMHGWYMSGRRGLPRCPCTLIHAHIHGQSIPRPNSTTSSYPQVNP